MKTSMKTTITLLLVLIAGAVGLGGCSDHGPSKNPSANVSYVLPVAFNEIKLMSYNVENLFDWEHDEGNTDWEYLPINHPLKERCKEISVGFYREACYKTDWTEGRARLKVSQLKRVVDVQGELPDVLGLAEVENEKIVAVLAEELGYERFKVTHGPDERGIEVALLFNETRLRMLSSRSIPVIFEEESHKEKPTRDILGVYFEVRATGDILAVYVNHWPSQSATSPKRVRAALALRKAVDEDSGQYPNRFHYVAMGDFNTIQADDPHPIETVLSDRAWNHRASNVHATYWAESYKQDPQGMKDKMPLGTYFYKRDLQWNLLDLFLVGPTLTDGERLEVRPETYRIVGPKFATEPFVFTYDNGKAQQEVPVLSIPLRQNRASTSAADAGYSDHFPIVVKLKF
jgi:endonuclease/exonuclease/phosphatase family metal-dependent hydrolase